mgnify:CR=1 FL=1
MTESKCLTEQDLTLLYYDENPDSMDLLAAHRHLKGCPVCRQRQIQLEQDMQTLPLPACELDPHYATRLAARVTDRVPRRRFALPAVAGGLVAALVVFSISFWSPETQTVVHNSATQQSVATDNAPQHDSDLLENLELLRELDTLSELTGV